MHPILFNFGGIPIYSYGVLVATGVLISLWYGRRQAPRAGIDPDKLWNMGIYFVLVALLVAKIWLILSAWDFYMANPRHVSIRRHFLRRRRRRRTDDSALHPFSENAAAPHA